MERRSQPGQETTARSGAIIRAHYGVPELVPLALEANRRYARFDDEVGLPCGFVQSGYSVLVDEADAQNLRAITAMHQSLGVNAHLLSPAELKAMVPAVKVDDAALVAWEPDGGFASPPADGRGLRHAGQRLGRRPALRRPRRPPPRPKGAAGA